MALFDRLKQIFAQGSTSSQAPEISNDPLVLRVILLLETAGYDSEFAPEEREAIERLLRERYGLLDQERKELMILARSHRAEVADIYVFTRELANALDMDQRKQLMTEIWEIIFADGRVDAEEEYFARKMQKLLRLDHPTWIAAKLEADRPS